MENNKKKQLIISVIGVIVLLLIVGTVSYAMYTFTGTGSKENVITSGAVSIDYAEQTNITLTNEYPKSDTLGINSTEQNSTMQFTVSANITGTQTINYAIGFDSITEGTTLTDSYVKVYLTKGDNVATGFTLNTGKTINSFRTSYIDGIMDSYAILTDSFNQTTSHTYTLKAWVGDNYKLPTTYAGTCSDTEYTTPDECRANGETWTDTTTGVHGNTTTSETFKFKIKVVATDGTVAIVDNSNITVLFNANGGNVNQTSKLITPNDLYGELPIPTRTNYTFDGWYTEANNGIKIESDTIMTNNIGHTLYAHWTNFSEWPSILMNLGYTSIQFNLSASQTMEQGVGLIVNYGGINQDWPSTTITSVDLSAYTTLHAIIDGVEKTSSSSVSNKVISKFTIGQYYYNPSSRAVDMFFFNTDNQTVWSARFWFDGISRHVISKIWFE